MGKVLYFKSKKLTEKEQRILKIKNSLNKINELMLKLKKKGN